MVLQPTIIVQGGSSGIPAYDNLEEITSPTEGMVVKINGQEGGSGTPRGVQVGDVLGVVTWAGTPDNLPFDETTGDGYITLITFSDASYMYTMYDGGDPLWEVCFRYGVEVYEVSKLASAYNNIPDWYDDPYDFGGRTVSAINDASIQSVIIVTPSAPAIPDKYYIYKDSAWVELVDLADIITVDDTDLEDGVSSLATGTYYFVIEE